MEELNSYTEKAIDMLMQYAPKLILAIVVLVLGLWIINRLIDLVGKGLHKSGITEDIRPFLLSLVGIGLKLLLIFSVAGIVGIETTSFVAVLAAAGFAIGIALQGSLSNFAAGVMILVFKPYKPGDLVDVSDVMGRVTEIQIFNTVVVTLDNRTVIIPNATAIGGVITNLSTRKFVRVDLNVTMPYNEDFDRVEGLLLAAVRSTPGVMDEPEPIVGIETFDSHNIVLTVRPYATADDYWDVYFAVNRSIKRAMGENGIKMAYSEGVELGEIGK